jgi:UDP-xylose/UDP-N-acetylglucosamine transporter B4
MITGYLIAGRRYSAGQLVSYNRLPSASLTMQFAGIAITLGIILATLSAPPRYSRGPSRATAASLAAPVATSDQWLSDTAQYLAGIALLSAALLVSACLGILQEKTYRVYGKQWREALFYSVPQSRTSQDRDRLMGML